MKERRNKAHHVKAGQIRQRKGIKMDKNIAKTINEYLNSVSDPISGSCWTSHSGADYVYWSEFRDREHASSFAVDASGLECRGLVDVTPTSIILQGPTGEVVLPVSFDFKKIRRRIEDALRKTATDENLLRIADTLNVSLI